MSAAYFVVLERDIDGFDPFMNGKALGGASDAALDDLCETLGVTPLTRFLSHDPDAMADLLGDEELPDGTPEAEWFEAADGLATVRALLAAATAEKAAPPVLTAVVSDLRELEAVLARLHDESVRWHLEIDV